MSRDIHYPQAAEALIRRALIEPGRERIHDLMVIGRRMYRITIEEVSADDMPEAARQFMEESTCPPPKHTS